MYGISKARFVKRCRNWKTKTYIKSVVKVRTYYRLYQGEGHKLRSFSEEIIDLGHKPGAKLLDKIVNADSEIAENLR